MSWAPPESLSEIFAHLGADHWGSALRRKSNHVQFLLNKRSSLSVIYINLWPLSSNTAIPLGSGGFLPNHQKKPQCPRELGSGREDRSETLPHREHSQELREPSMSGYLPGSCRRSQPRAPSSGSEPTCSHVARFLTNLCESLLRPLWPGPGLWTCRYPREGVYADLLL